MDKKKCINCKGIDALPNEDYCLDCIIDTKRNGIVAGVRNYLNNVLLKYAIRKYIKYNKDELGIFTVIAKQLGFKYYPTQSMLVHEDASNFINHKDHVISMQYNEHLDREEINVMKNL